MDNSGREGLLLEVVKNFTGITYPEYADDKTIKKKIYDYLKLLENFSKNKEDFPIKDYQKLNKLHRFFYGVSFNPEDPSANAFKTPIYDKFKSVFEKIEKSINETNDINAELLKSLLSLITVYYDSHKNKDEIINEYLDKVIVPLLNSYKGIGVASDLKMSVKEEKEEKETKDKKPDTKEQTVAEVQKLNIPNVAESTKKLETKTPIQPETSKEREEREKREAKEREEREKREAKEREEREAKEREEREKREAKERKEREAEEARKKAETTKKTLTDDKLQTVLENLEKNPEKLIEEVKLQKTTNKLYDDININLEKYKQLKKYLQAFYLESKKTQPNFKVLSYLIKKINELNLKKFQINFSNIITSENIEPVLKEINKLIVALLTEHKIEELLEDYNENHFKKDKSFSLDKNAEIIILLLSLKDNNFEYESKYIIPEEKNSKYYYNLIILSKLYNNNLELNKFFEDNFKKLLNFLKDDITRFDDILENIRLLLNYYSIKDIRLFTTSISKDKFSFTKNRIKLYDDILDFLNSISNEEIKKLYEEISQNKLKYNLEILANYLKFIYENNFNDDLKKNFKDLIKELIPELSDNDFEEYFKELERVVKTETNLKNYQFLILKVFNNYFKNIKYETSGGDKLNQDGILDKLCAKEYNLDTFVDNVKLREILKFKKYYTKEYKLKQIKLEGIILDDNYFKENKGDFNCDIEIDGIKIKIRDIIYIESNKYKLPDIYIEDSLDVKNKDEKVIEQLLDFVSNVLMTGGGNVNDEKLKIILGKITGNDNISDDIITKIKNFYQTDPNLRRYLKFYKEYNKYKDYNIKEFKNKYTEVKDDLEKVIRYYDILDSRNDIINALLQEISRHIEPVYFIREDKTRDQYKKFTFKEFFDYIKNNSKFFDSTNQKLLKPFFEILVKEKEVDAYKKITEFLAFKDYEYQEHNKSYYIIVEKDKGQKEIDDFIEKIKSKTEYKIDDFIEKSKYNDKYHLKEDNLIKYNINDFIYIFYKLSKDKLDYFKYYINNLEDLLTFKSFRFNKHIHSQVSINLFKIKKDFKKKYLLYLQIYKGQNNKIIIDDDEEEEEVFGGVGDDEIKRIADRIMKDENIKDKEEEDLLKHLDTTQQNKIINMTTFLEEYKKNTPATLSKLKTSLASITIDLFKNIKSKPPPAVAPAGAAPPPAPAGVGVAPAGAAPAPAPAPAGAVKIDDDEEDEENLTGGFKNFIELNDVFKLYYSYLSLEGNDENITNIYKLYFIINIYAFYNIDKRDKYELITNLLEIIKTDVFNDDLNESIKKIIIDIYKDTKEIYEIYTKTFDNTDKIIKNLCQTPEAIHKYLHINFIYDFYKNYNKNDINLKLNINGNIIKIRKTSMEINKEMDEFLMNELIFIPTTSLNIDVYDNEIDNFIHFIYIFTKDQSISINNINDLNAYIVLQLLSKEDDINLNINKKIFLIKNIDNHPYKFNNYSNTIEINLNENQMKIYERLLKNGLSKLLRILGKDYYYLNFDIHSKSIFKFNLNYEIIKLISTIDFDNFQRTIINYNSYKFMKTQELTNLSILNVEKVRIIFLINYGIYLSSSLFSQINHHNFFSLIQIYFLIKNNTKEYVNLINYKKDNKSLIEYRNFLKTTNFISFLKSILSLMRIKLNLETESKFIYKVINFKDIKTSSSIKIDTSFLKKLFDTTSYEMNRDIINTYHKSFNIIYNNCFKGKLNEDIIKIFHIFIIPSLRFLSKQEINIREIENEVLDIKAYEYMKLIGFEIKGGEGEVKVPNIDVRKVKEQLKENKKQEFRDEGKDTKFVATTALSDNSKEILKELEKFNEFYIEFSKLNLDKLFEDFTKVFNNFFEIYEEIYITDEDKSQTLLEKLDYKGDKKEFNKKITQVKNKIANNVRNLNEVVKQFSYREYENKEKKGELNDKAKNLGNVLKLFKEIQSSLSVSIKQFKGKSREVDNLLLQFYPEEDNEVSLLKKIEDFLAIYKKKFDIFLVIIKEALANYDLINENVKKQEGEGSTYFKNVELEDTKIHNEKITEIQAKIRKLRGDIENYENKIKSVEKEKEFKEKELERIEDATRKALKVNDINKDDDRINDYKKEIDKFQEELKRKETELSEERGKKFGGGKDPIKPINQPNIKDLLDKKIEFDDKDQKVGYEDRFNDIKKRFDNIKKDYKKLKVSTYIPNSVDKDLIVDKFIDKNGDTLFEQILNNYAKDEKTKNQELAKANFYENVDVNNLDPQKELEITFVDKLIFAFLILFLRYAGLYITYKFIDNKFVKSIKEAIIYYSLSYVAVLFAFVVIVNIDLFRLRIIFNYCNLHINSTGILSHMIIKIIIGYIIYLLIVNLDNEPVPTYLSKNQKIKLKKKLDILTMIVLIFLLIFVIII